MLLKGIEHFKNHLSFVLKSGLHGLHMDHLSTALHGTLTTNVETVKMAAIMLLIVHGVAWFGSLREWK
jgi:hypothetical protein